MQLHIPHPLSIYTHTQLGVCLNQYCMALPLSYWGGIPHIQAYIPQLIEEQLTLLSLYLLHHCPPSTQLAHATMSTHYTAP